MDRFEIVRRLPTQGACGTVMFAKDTKNNNAQVVVKQLPANDVRSMTERRVMRNLRHNNIVRFLDSWISVEEVPNAEYQEQLQQLQHQYEQQVQQHQQQTKKGAAVPPPPPPQLVPMKNGKPLSKTIKQKTLNIAMEYVRGGDLRSAIRQRRSSADNRGFPEPIIRSWLVQMCSALYYCHSQHIIHRDLKAENVLLSDTPTFAGSASSNQGASDDGSLSAPAIKIADFGFAKELAESSAFATTRLGTPHSLPPEIYDHTPYNNRADMWCVGVILYEIMTLTRPFIGQTMEQLFNSIMRHEPTPAEQLSKGMYSKELYDLQRRLLSKNPMLRPSAREVLSFDWLAPLVEKIRQFPMSDEQRCRDQAAWDRISVQAEYSRTILMELALPNTTVNVRDSPSFNGSRIVLQLQPGDFIEVVDEVVDAANVKWLRTTRGYCIKITPMPPPRDMFRRIAEWRVRRPSMASSAKNNNNSNLNSPTGGGSSNKSGSAPSSPIKTPAGASPINNNNNNNNQQTTPTSLFGPMNGDSDEARSNAEAAKNALETQVKADQLASTAEQNRFLLGALVSNGVPEDLLQHLIEKYNDLAAPLDDMPWTIYCVDALRPLRLVPWVPVLRWVAIVSLAAVVSASTTTNNNKTTATTTSSNEDQKASSANKQQQQTTVAGGATNKKQAVTVVS